MKCQFCDDENAIHYIGGGFWVCFKHFLKLFWR